MYTFFGGKMKFRAIITVLAAALIVTGCAAKKSAYLEEQPIIILPQQTGEVKNIPQLQEKSTQTFIAALNRFHWEIRDVNKNQNTITAEGCEQGVHCAEIIATVLTDGSISVIRTPDQELTIKEGAMLKRRLGDLQHQYQKNMQNVL
jgi:hypothetical protein